MILLSINGQRVTLQPGDIAEIKEEYDSRPRWWPWRDPRYLLYFYRPREDGERLSMMFEDWPGSWSGQVIFKDEDDAYKAAELAGGALGLDISQSGTELPIRLEYIRESL